MATLTYVEPLNLIYLFGNLFSGNVIIFTALIFLTISVLGGLFKMSDRTFLMMVALASIMFYGLIGGGLYLLVVLISSLIIYYSIKKIVQGF